ncbi:MULTISPECIES: indole-3-glycerol phosphate synthase TrpC [Brevibacterium]|uniref:Indole-3-glycerol phosphate synthase n=1 Tax=Brevibacterium salitolerans TaxID=1403566 RepID=A0ABN2WF88_9MICO|nr:indole-3-glycerol phosphate synthase TrpC [Brevibacterium sp.]
MTVLDAIVAGVREDLDARRRALPLEAVRAQAEQAPAVRPFPADEEFGLICEVKRSSPSKGELAAIPDPAALAGAYARGGAAAISVLTESRRFAGTLADLDAVRAAVDVPVLRKDFMVEEYQFHEARAHGADIVLLIVAALSDAQLGEFLALSRALGMAALVETHTAAELDRARDAGAELVGVNTRNLKDLSVDPARFRPLAAHAPAGTRLVAESGVSDADSVAAYAAAGAGLVLVGEALVKDGDPESAVARFTAAGAAAASAPTQE